MLDLITKRELLGIKAILEQYKQNGFTTIDEVLDSVNVENKGRHETKCTTVKKPTGKDKVRKHVVCPECGSERWKQRRDNQKSEYMSCCDCSYSEMVK